MHITRLRIPLTSSGLIAAAMGLAALSAVTVGAVAAAAGQPAGPTQNVTIPFADRHGIEDWQADGDRGLWILSRDHKWYYARFFAPCFGLQFHEALRFKFGAAGELDRWSEVSTNDSGRCAFTSLVASDGPPPKVKAIKPVATPAAPTPPAPVPAG